LKKLLFFPTKLTKMGELERLLEDLKQDPLSFSCRKNLLDHLEEAKLRRPDLVIKWGEPLLKQNKLKEFAKWRLVERLYLSSIDTKDSDRIGVYEQMLREKFPQNCKVYQLVGRRVETEASLAGDKRVLQDEIKKYKKLANTSDEKPSLLKHQISILSQTEPTASKAITSLNKYLGVYQNDKDSWCFLKNLHLRQMNWDQAKFCLEELLLITPNDYLLSLQYAEVLVALGGADNDSLAMKYYEHSIWLNDQPSNTRAYAGLVLCAKLLNEEEFSPERKKILSIARKNLTRFFGKRWKCFAKD